MSNEDKQNVLAFLSNDELRCELARRLASESAKPMWDFEEEVEREQQAFGGVSCPQYLEKRSVEYGNEPRPCPKCGKAIRVRKRDRTRIVRTMSGEVKLSRHYHYCEWCQYGFLPAGCGAWS